jgi:hypothetical protein
MPQHFIGESIELPPSNCIGCGKLVDAATPVDIKTVTPAPGDITICFYCGHIMVYADDLSLRNPTDVEMFELAGNKTILAMQRMRGKAPKDQ